MIRRLGSGSFFLFFVFLVYFDLLVCRGEIELDMRLYPFTYRSVPLFLAKFSAIASLTALSTSLADSGRVGSSTRCSI